jgi:hypothetical protein
MGDELRRKKVKGPKIYSGLKGLKYADIGYFGEDISDLPKLGSPSTSFVVLNGDVLGFDPKIERFVYVKKLSTYRLFKLTLDAVEYDLVGERDGVWFFVRKEIDGYQGWVYWRDGLVYYQLEGWVHIDDD